MGMELSRREFLRKAATVAVATVLGYYVTGCKKAAERLVSPERPNPAPVAEVATPEATGNVTSQNRSNPVATQEIAGTVEARYYQPGVDGKLNCTQCPRRCLISPGGRGFCQTRENKGGRLYSLVYGKPCVARPVPIEKAPIFHMLPGTNSYSIATAGCNLACLYCQNYSISRAKPEEVEIYDLPPERVVAEALKNGCRSITFTYSEPTIAFEYLLDIARVARAKGIKTVVKTGGYINPEPLKELCHAVDAINVDLKGFSETFYRDVCSGELKYVLDTIIRIKAEGTWLEVANLVVPGYNDDDNILKALRTWVRQNLGTEVPLYFSRFEPAYRLKGLPPTPMTTLERARALALDEGLRYVYIGNIPRHQGTNTYCHHCHQLLIERVGFTVVENRIISGKCAFCETAIPGNWS